MVGGGNGGGRRLAQVARSSEEFGDSQVDHDGDHLRCGLALASFGCILDDVLPELSGSVLDLPK